MREGGRSAGVDYCQRYQLSESSLEAVLSGKVEYAGMLADLGFISREDAQEASGRGRGGGFDGSAESAWLLRPVNRNWGNAR